LVTATVAAPVARMRSITVLISGVAPDWLSATARYPVWSTRAS
jgi:hypothetical protein